VERDGSIPSALKNALRSFADTLEFEDEFVQKLDLADASSRPDPNRDGPESLGLSRTSLIKNLDEYILPLASEIEREKHSADVDAARASLPNSRELDQILRCEASLDRQLYAAVRLLQALKNSARNKLLQEGIAESAKRSHQVFNIQQLRFYAPQLGDAG